MPLYKTITVNEHTKVLLKFGEIEESFAQLIKSLSMTTRTDRCQQRRFMV
jgi:hypothetical protein